MDFSKLTQELWECFFSNDVERSYNYATKWCIPKCIIIGTGSQEFYTDLDSFLLSFADEIADRNDVEFKIDKLQCDEMRIDSNTCMVYGKLSVSGENKDKSVLINLDSRFTFIFHKFDEQWKIIHIHQSVPNPEQGDGEYYPKTLMKKVQELQCVNAKMSELAKKDGLTGLNNFRTFCSQWKKRNEYGWFFVLDLDHFKQINDIYGHLSGNDVLIRMSKVFCAAVRESDLLCRMGGDEFLIFCSEMKDQNDAAEFAQRLIIDIENAGDSLPYWTTVSIGATLVTPSMSIESALENAERSLYAVKRTKRGCYDITTYNHI